MAKRDKAQALRDAQDALCAAAFSSRCAYERSERYPDAAEYAHDREVARGVEQAAREVYEGLLDEAHAALARHETIYVVFG
jgi:hypothetical protein